MNRAVTVQYKEEFKIFTSLKKACREYQLNYHTVGKCIRENGVWKNDKISIQRHLVE